MTSRRGGGVRTRKEQPVQRQTIQTLSKKEIDERIERVMSEIAVLVGGEGGAEGSGAPPRLPVWITPRALVERMRRFLVYN